jgi:lysophospholipase L1-like esterase
MMVVLAALSAPRASAAVVYPGSIASTGDSITRAYNTGFFSFIDAIENSWSTGTSSSVNSIYRRILTLNPAISGRNYNEARTGAKMVDLNGQVTVVNGRHVDYVTILMGGNDVCTSSEATMTSVQTFRNQFQVAMNTLTSGSPNARIYVVSIPNVYNLWSVLKGNSSARFTWALFGICQSMLANPLSTAQADVSRRARVRQRNIDFNTQLQQVCALYIQCRFDNNAVFNTVFVARDISTRDYFHPSLAGQAKLAATAWAASGLAQ